MLANREIKTRLEKAFPIKQAMALTDVFIEFKDDLVKSGDFNELKNIVKELAEAQKRTEGRMEELAEAQKRTEVKMEELAEAQKRTEECVKDLAGAQKQTDKHMKELAGAQKRTEGHLEELAGAQKRTDEELVLFRRTFTSQIGGLGARWGI